MKEKLLIEIEVPEGVNASLEENILKVTGSQGEVSRDFKLGRNQLKVEGNKIIFSNKKGTKTDKRMMNTITAHIKNMIKGVQEKFEYKVKICFGHFPFTVKQDGNKVIVKKRREEIFKVWKR
jgi:large subunit ribosomal protein L6